MRYLLYSHDGFGLGHTRRHLAIARALTRLDADASVLLASGSEEAHRFGLPPRVELLKLPALRKVANGHYISRRLPISSQDVLALRSELLLTAAESFQPMVVLADKYPFGVCGELRPALERARANGAHAVLGLRDILDEPAVVRNEWEHQRDEIPALFDLVLVYGERNVFDPVTQYEFVPAVAARTHFCGYVLNEPSRGIWPAIPRAAWSSRPLVVATAGGGEDGFTLLQNFLHASEGAPWHPFVVTGPMLAESAFSELEQLAAKAGGTLHRFVPNLHQLFRSAAVLVCMGGYNTLVEAAAAGAPTICVPRVTPRREQAMRADAFERLGLLRALQPDQVTPQRLRTAVEGALANAAINALPEGAAVLRFDGASQAARHLHDLTLGCAGVAASTAAAAA